MPQPYEHLARSSERLQVTEVSGGHMHYERLLINTEEDGRIFAKLHDASRFTDPVRERHSREYLTKEHAMLMHLQAHDFPHIPADVKIVGDHSLIMESLSDDDGWQWRAPSDNTEQYTRDVLAALAELETIAHPPNFLDSHGPAHTAFATEGWHNLEGQLDTVAHTLHSVLPKLQPHMHRSAQELASSLATLRAHPLPPEGPSYFSHHDLRQANVAWHPHYGVKIVDWSWAGVGLERADQTSFLIDLHKSGRDVTSYLEDHFNAEHAHILLGFLLARSIAPAQDNNTTVRFHQTVSAISTYDLLRQQEQL